jgi:hypothetical protein
MFFLTIEERCNIPSLNGTPELYKLHRQIRHSFSSSTLQTDSAVLSVSSHHHTLPLLEV